MGNNLRELRVERDWTHEVAAQRMGVSRGQFIKLERGERKLTERTIDLAARAFGVPKGRVLGDDVPARAISQDGDDEPPAIGVAATLARIDARLRLLGMSEVAASKAAGKPDVIQEMRRAVESNEQPSLSPATLNALAPVLKTTAVWLIAGAGPESTDRDEGVSRPGRLPELDDQEPELVGPAQEVELEYTQADYGGVVEAGAFRPIEEFELDPERGPDFVPKDADFPFAKLVTFTVSGDSMNALKPDPIRPGARITCIDYERSISRLPFRTGMVVVVEQSKNGGQLRERSVKQIEINGEQVTFWPRSTNPKHKPIVVPRIRDRDDGRQVRIIAIVREITNRVKLA